MAFIPIVSAVSSALKPLFKIVDDLIPDSDKAVAFKAQLQMAMLSARWTQLMVLISGVAIILACLFNLVCKAFGRGITIEFALPEMLILIGMFIFSASGSPEVLTAIAEFLIDTMKKNKRKEK